MKTILALVLLSTSAFAVPDDGNPATIRARFTWQQIPPDPIITHYHLTYWRAAETPELGKTVEVPTVPQEGEIAEIQVIEDGFVQGVTYKAHVTAANETDESDPCVITEFRIPVIIPPPTGLKVDIQVSADLKTWKSIAFIPLDEQQRFVRARVVAATK